MGMGTTLGRCEILLVEDSEGDAFLTREQLGDARHPNTLHVVPDGVEALAFLGRRGVYRDRPAPDLVLLDLGLPGLHGREVLRLIRAEHEALAPVIIVSGAPHERAGEYLRSGAVDYVMKGDAARLCAAVDDALEAASPLRRLSPSQRRVLRLLAEGHSTRDIAARLGVSAKTVEAHRAAIGKRLGTRALADQVRLAVRTGLVPLEAARAADPP